MLEETLEIPRVKREKKEIHWIVVDLFEMADTKGIDERSLETLILQKTGRRIPHTTLRYWKNKWSEPKISEVDLIAQALDYELDLMSRGPKQ